MIAFAGHILKEVSVAWVFKSGGPLVMLDVFKGIV